MKILARNYDSMLTVSGNDLKLCVSNQINCSGSSLHLTLSDIKLRGRITTAQEFFDDGLNNGKAVKLFVRHGHQHQQRSPRKDGKRDASPNGQVSFASILKVRTTLIMLNYMTRYALSTVLSSSHPSFQSLNPSESVIAPRKLSAKYECMLTTIHHMIA